MVSGQALTNKINRARAKTNFDAIAFVALPPKD